MARRLALAIALALLIPAAPAAAAPQWLLPPKPIQAFQPFFLPAPELAIDPSGNAVAVWLRETDVPFPGTGEVVAAVRPAGGDLGAPQVLSAGTASATPQVAIDGQGNATAIWAEAVGANTRVLIATRPPGGPFGPSTPISPEGDDSSSPALALNASGAAIFLWRNNDSNRIEAAARSSSTADIAQLGGIDPPAAMPVQEPAVGIDSQGNAVAAWVEFDGDPAPDYDRVRAAFRPAGGSFQAGTLFPAAGNEPDEVDVAMSENGDAVVLWWTNPLNNVRAAIRPAGGSFPGSPATLAQAGDSTASAQVAIDPQGTAIAVWDNFTDGRMEYAVRAPGQAFGSAQTLVDADGSVSEVAIGPNGHAVAAWTDEETPAFSTRIHASVRPPGGSFGAPAPLSGGNPITDIPTDIEVDAAGNALLAWGRLDSANSLYGAEFAPYDNAGPAISGVQVPEAAKTGTPVSVSASASDFVGPVSTGWDFGDASGAAAGTQASHTYTQPGSYQLRFTATDAAGFATTETRTLNVTDGIAPALTKVSLSPRAFEVGRRPTARSAKSGSKIRYTLSEAALVTLRIERARPGRRAGGKCLKPRRRNRSGRRCTRYVRAGSLTRGGKAGANSVKFSGRVGRKALRRGRHRLVVQATDPAGNRSAARRAKFRIKK